MNALAVQNPCHKCDLGNNLRMIQSLTRKLLQKISDCSINYYSYYTEIILYLCVCVCVCVRYNLTVLKSGLENSFNHGEEINGWSKKLQSQLEVVAATTSIILHFKLWFDSDRLQAKWAVFQWTFLLPDITWKLLNGDCELQKLS